MGVTCLKLRSEDAHFRSPSPREQIQIIGVFCLFVLFLFFYFFGFLRKKLFTPAACPEPDLTAALSVVLNRCSPMLASDTVYQSPARDHDPEL